MRESLRTLIRTNKLRLDAETLPVSFHPLRTSRPWLGSLSCLMAAGSGNGMGPGGRGVPFIGEPDRAVASVLMQIGYF